MRRVLFFFTLLVLTAQDLRAGQFMGGELSYRLVQANNTEFTYELRLVIYRDCRSLATLDPPVIRILNTTNLAASTQILLYREETLTNRTITPLPYTIPSYCVINDPRDCVDRIEYRKLITLPYSREGYTFYYWSCCRFGLTNLQPGSWNGDIEMISQVPEPGQALTFSAQVPSHDSVLINNSPQSGTDSVIYACKGRPLRYRFAFQDIDGDSLVYRIGQPWGKTPTATTNFNWLVYQPPFTQLAPFGGAPAVLLNAQNGALEGVPDRAGAFLLMLDVEEYRNGRLIGRHRREYPVNVRDCDMKKPPEVINCRDRTAVFEHANNTDNTYRWDFGVPEIGTDVSAAPTPTYTFPRPGTFTVTLHATSPRGCTDSIQTEARIYPGLQVDFEFTGKQCKDQPIQFTDRTVLPVGTIISRTWRNDNNGAVLSNASSFSLVPQVSGTMPYPLGVWLVVQNNFGCRDSIQKVVEIYPWVTVNAGPDRILPFNTSYTMPATASGAFQYQWSPATGLSHPNVLQPVLQANTDQTYRLVATNPGGCDGIDSVQIRYMKGPEIYVPTAFTPNGDGKNDRLHFYPAGYEPESLAVYNRWGAIVFTTKDVSQGWDGKVRGKEQPTGVYIWTVKARAYDGSLVNLKGTVTLIR